MRPRLLDLCSGAGGAGFGYDLAGFDVTGLDHDPQPNYPFAFIQGDALEALADREFMAGFDAIHASPPCQVFSVATPESARGNHLDLLTPMRELLLAQPLPWVIENVPGAPMRVDYRLCGCMFGLRTETRQLVRERWFETSWRGFEIMPSCHHTAPAITITTKGQPNRTGYAPEAKQVMGIGWMSQRELGLAIPPAYTEFLGARLLEQITSERAA